MAITASSAYSSDAVTGLCSLLKVIGSPQVGVGKGKVFRGSFRSTSHSYPLASTASMICMPVRFEHAGVQAGELFRAFNARLNGDMQHDISTTLHSCTASADPNTPKGDPQQIHTEKLHSAHPTKPCIGNHQASSQGLESHDDKASSTRMHVRMLKRQHHRG